MLKQKISLFIAFFIASVSLAGTTSFLSSSWNLEHTPDTFIHDVAMSCLTAAAAHVKAEGKTVSLEDDQHCSTEIHALSMVWDRSPEVPMKSINTRRLNEVKIQKAVQEHFGSLSSDELKLLPSEATNGKVFERSVS